MTLNIVVHDVGHGQSIHAFTPAGQVIVIDLGCSADFSPLAWLREQTEQIDLLVITHPHGDHIDEMLLIAGLGFKVRQFWRPKWLPKAEVYKQNQATYTEKLDKYFEMSDSYYVEIPSRELVGEPLVSGGVSIKNFSSQNCGVSNINNHSGVVVFDYSGSKVMIPGDNEPASWNELKKQPTFQLAAKNTDIYLASHHGRNSGYEVSLFELFKPSLCLISDGRVQDTDATNRYSYHATGWTIHSRCGNPSAKRNCVTTRSDGAIEIQIGKNLSSGSNFLSVHVQ